MIFLFTFLGNCLGAFLETLLSVIFNIKLPKWIGKVALKFAFKTLGEFLRIARCKEIRIPQSGKFLHVESGILGLEITNTALGIRL